MERPERPTRHKSHDKWKRIIHPAVDSDSSSDWSTVSSNPWHTILEDLNMSSSLLADYQGSVPDYDTWNMDALLVPQSLSPTVQSSTPPPVLVPENLVLPSPSRAQAPDISHSNEGSPPTSVARKRPYFYPPSSSTPAPGPSSSTGEYKPQGIGDSVSEKMQRLRSLYQPDFSYVPRYSGSKRPPADAAGDSAGTSLNYHLLHHDYAERDTYRAPSSSDTTAWFLRPSERKRSRIFSGAASAASAEPEGEEEANNREDTGSLHYPLSTAPPPPAEPAADNETRAEDEPSTSGRRHLHDHSSRYLDSRIFTWKRLANKMFVPLSSSRTDEPPDVQVISMAGPSTSQRTQIRPPKKEVANPEEVIILEDTPQVAAAADASAEQMPAVVVSAARQDEESLNQNLIGLLECPVCMEYMSPPIHQCRRGHLVCVNCKPKLPLCPTCRSRLTDSRNLAMEKVADKLLYPCKNANDGCQEHLRLKDKGDHEANCDYRTYRCSLPLCDWKGLKDDLLPHYTAAHKDDLLYGEQQELLLQLGDFSTTTNQNWIVSAHGELFRVNFITMTTTPRLQLFETGNSRMQIFGCTQYIGPQCRSNNFAYTMKLQQRDGKQRCVYFSRATHTDLVNCATNYATGDSFYMRGDTAELLNQGALGNLVLHVQLLIQPNSE